MRRIKWGVIGCGGIADRRTIPGMMKAQNAELVAVMDVNPELAQKCREKYGAKYAFTDENELLALDEIEAVYIATPVFCHKRQAMAARKIDLSAAPASLGATPGADSGSTDAFARLDDLDGEKLEAALGNLARTDPAAYERWLAAA